MKGYRMVLLVNGGIFLFIAVNAFLLAHVLTTQADRCDADPPARPDCDQTRDTATTALRVAPMIAAVGVILLVLGAILGRAKHAEGLGPATPSSQQRMPEDWTKALHPSPDGLVIDLEVVPNSSSPGFPAGYNPWRHRIQARVGAPPEDGKANEELVILVAAALNVPRGQVSVVDGHTSRRKRVAVRGLDVAEFTRRVTEALGER
ncbi:MAG TPA: DUF167 domain-containing protein [Candidatus Thermoplasmatota archaeon]